jgi:hypothetical protein
MIGNFADVMRTSFDTENQLSVGVLNDLVQYKVVLIRLRPELRQISERWMCGNHAWVGRIS